GERYAIRFGSSRRQSQSNRRGGSGKRSGLLARTTSQTIIREELLLRAVRARVSHRIHFVLEKSREEIRRSRRVRCGRVRAGETRCSIAMGHSASRSKLGVGKNGRCARSARSRPRFSRFDLIRRGIFPGAAVRSVVNAKVSILRVTVYFL